MLKSRRILALVVALVMTVGMLPTSAFAAEPGETEQGHVHTADCYAETLTCGLDEHTHGDDCYTISETPAQDEDNGGSEENSGSDDAGAAEPEPAPDAGSEDSGDQGGENESSDASSDSEGESGETSGSDSADSGDSAPAEEPSAPAESAPAEETNIADEPAPLAAAPAKELTCSLEEHTHGEGCYEQTLVCGLEEDEEAEAPEANGGAAATEEPSEAVQAFLEAVAQLPETVDEENVEEVQSLMEACQDAYDALEPEDLEREDVQAALAKMASLMEQVETLALVFPTEPVAKIGDVEYPMLALAAQKAAPGDTITLMTDVTESVTVSQSVTFDLNDHTWTGRNDTALIVTGGNDVAVTVKNGAMKAADGFDASSAGSVIHAEKCDLTIENCTIDGTARRLVQVASTSGKIHPSVTLTIKDSEFSNASYAAVYAAVEGNIKERSMRVDISNTTFTNNAKGLYSSVNNTGSDPVVDVSVADCNFEGSTEAGIYVANTDNSNVDNITLNVTNSNFLNGSGSAIATKDYATVNVSGGTISDNKEGSYPYTATIRVYGPFAMNGTKVTENSNSWLMDLEKTSAVSIKDATFSNNESTNTSDLRGTIYIDANANAKVDVSGSTFEGNLGRYGGALHIKGSGVTTNISGSTFKKNVSRVSGGAIYLNTANGNATITDTIITENTANDNGKIPGGGLYVANTTGTVTLGAGTKIYRNHTPNATVKHELVGASADIALASLGVKGTKIPSEDAATRATLNLECETEVMVDETKYTLTKSDAKGLQYSTGSRSPFTYYWAIGYYTITEEPLRVFLGAEDQHTGDKAVMTTTVEEAVSAAREKGLDTIYVCSTIVLDDAKAKVLNENSDITFARCAEHPNGYMFTVSSTVTLDGAHIDGKRISSDRALIFVPSSGHLTIAGDTLIENGKNVAGEGGAIELSQSGLTMTGGTITNNSAIEGGGIHAYSNYNGAEMIFAGGVISNNKATGGNGGGGAYIGYIPSQFIAGTDGAVTTFSGNESNQLGGGVYLVGNTHKIERAVFTGNKSYRTGYYYDGGAIYVDKGTTAHMKNVYVSGNTDGDPWLANNNYTAVAVCPTGELAVYELDGLLSVNNNGKVDIGVVAGGIVSGADPVVYLPSYAPGGGSVSYTDSKGNPVDISNDHFKQGSFKVKTQASDQAIALAKETAEKSGVVITGNYANQYGAGIMTNGLLKIGTETTTLRVNKVWADGNENHDGDQILVYLTQDGEIVDEDFRADSSVILNKDNNWSYTWTNLGDEFTWGVKEASVPGYTSEVKVEKDTQFKAIADKFYVATITNTSTPDENANKLVIRKTAMGLDPDVSYKFTLKLDNVGDQIFALQLDGTLYPIYNNEITFYLKDQQSAVVDGLPDGFTYEVTEEESAEYTAYVFESVTANEGGAGQIKTVDVVNMPTTRVEVTKTWEDDGNAQNTRPESITVNLLANGKKEGFAVITPDADGQWKHTFTGLPKFDAENNEIRYTVEEEPVDGYEATYEGSNITNRYQWGSLTIQKKVEGVATGEQMFKFVVTGPHDYRKEVTLKAGESETLEKLIPGTYHVEEIKDNANVPLYSVEVKGEGDVIVEKDKNSSTTITNAYTPLPGGLTIKKFVEGGPESAQKAEYTFIVTGPQYPNGTEVTVKAGESKTLSDLIPGVYTVKEKDAEIDGYELTVEGEGNVEVPKNGSAEATIRNTYTGGSLTISKAVNGGTDYAQNEKVYTFKVTGPDNYSETVTLKGGESKKLENLKAGKYTVEEENASIDGHVWRVEGTGDVTVSAKENTGVAVTNHYVPTDGLSVSKTVTGNGGDRNREFTFVIELTDGDVALSGVFAVVAEAFVDGVEAPEIKELTFEIGRAHV